MMRRINTEVMVLRVSVSAECNYSQWMLTTLSVSHLIGRELIASSEKAVTKRVPHLLR